jgi:anti-sigma factor RsiW
MKDGERPITDDDLHAFVDGVLDAERRLAVERHLAQYPEAAARVAAWHSVGALLHEATDWKAEEPVPARLYIDRLLEARRARRWQPARVAAGILLALTVGAGAGWMARGRPAHADRRRLRRHGGRDGAPHVRCRRRICRPVWRERQGRARELAFARARPFRRAARSIQGGLSAGRWTPRRDGPGPCRHVSP